MPDYESNDVETAAILARHDATAEYFGDVDYPRYSDEADPPECSSLGDPECGDVACPVHGVVAGDG